VNNGDEKESVSDNSIQQGSALRQASDESLDVLATSVASSNKDELHVDQALLSNCGEVPGLMSRYVVKAPPMSCPSK
jgi:hypothetical protein